MNGLLDGWALYFDISGGFHLQPGLPTGSTWLSMEEGERYKTVATGLSMKCYALPLLFGQVKKLNAIIHSEAPRFPLALLFLVRVSLVPFIPNQLSPALS